MLYYLSQLILSASAGTAWEEKVSFLRLLRYISFRSAGAAVTALLLSLWLGPKVIGWLKRLKFGRSYAEPGDKSRTGVDADYKKGVPIMGGILIVTTIDLSAILWAQLSPLVILTLVSLIGLSGLGFYDDYAKIMKQNTKGATARLKLGVQTLLALFIALYLWSLPGTRKLVTEVFVPFYKHAITTGAPFLGVIVAIITIVGSSNAVNLTDGMDGLAIGCTIIVTAVFVVLTYIAGNVRFAGYLQVPYVAGAGELTVVCAAILGAGLGFWWFNCYPAQVWMGDTGSLALGGVLGIIAVLIQQPLMLFIAGGVFVAEAVSVMIQVSVFKYFKRRYGVDKRVFLMTPIHHHFQKLGWPETRVVARFYILCLLCAVLALATLKIR